MGIIILNAHTILNKLWLVVLALALQDIPVVKATISWLRVQVILADDASPVASLLKSFGEGPLWLIELGEIILHKTINVWVFAS